jgi:hypothetical protein
VFGLFFTAAKTPLDASVEITAEGVTGIYSGMGPASAVYPFITITGTIEKTNRTPHISYEGRLLITAFDTDEARACRIAGAITATLDNATLNATGWSQSHCVGAELFSQDPDVEGIDYYRRGQYFEVGFDQG